MIAAKELNCIRTEQWAVISQRSQLSRGALIVEATRLRERFARHGIQHGERIGICGENSAEFVTAFLALAMLDTSIVLLDRGQFASGSEATFVAALDRLVHVDRTNETSQVIKGWFPDGQQCDVIDLRTLLSLPPGSSPSPANNSEADLPLNSLPWMDRTDGLVLLSSGSTGQPKPVIKRPSEMAQNCLRTHALIGYRHDDILLPLLPFTHQYGFSVLMIGLLLGLPVVVASPKRPSEAIRFATRHGVTIVDTTPSIYQVIFKLLESKKISSDQLESIRLYCSGGSPLSASTQRLASATLGTRLWDGYGSTEMGNVAHALPEDPDTIVPLPGIELRIVNVQGQIVESGQCGHLQVRSPDLPAYWQSQLLDGWANTDDLATLSQTGSLTVLGRLDAINRNGLTLYPKAVESRLTASGLSTCCLGVENLGSSSKLVVIVEDSFRRSAGEWKRRISGLVPAQDIPDKILVLGELPRTANGKVNESRLARFAQAILDPVQATSQSPVEEKLKRLEAVLEYIKLNEAEVLSVLGEYCDRKAACAELDAFRDALTGASAELVLEDPITISTSWVYMPSNVVMYSYALYLLIPALYTDKIWFRPSSRVFEATLRIHNMLVAVHGLDIQLFNGTQQEYEQFRAGVPGLVVFTGRHANAELVRSGIGAGQVMAFFGQGTNPFVIGPDADLDLAVCDAVNMRMLNAGQDCFGPDMYLVHEDIGEEFMLRVQQSLAQFSLAMVSAKSPDHYSRIRDKSVLHEVVQHLITHRSAVRWGGRLDVSQGIVEPTVLSWHISQAPACHEVFAPVFNIIQYNDENQVCELLDGDEYRQRAMGASVYGTSTTLNQWLDQRMTVSLNATLIATDDPHQPFGGTGSIAGYIFAAGKLTAQPILLSRVARDFASMLGHMDRRLHV